MKLRLETGNFKMVGTTDGEGNAVFPALPKGLTPEDFIGCVIVQIDDDNQTNFYSVISGAVDDLANNKVVLSYYIGTDSFGYSYDRLTGEVTFVGSETLA